MIRLVIADDHAVVRRGLTGMLGELDDVEVVGVAADGAEAVRQVGELAPDLVLMDLQMPVMDGVAATRTITEQSPGTDVLILTSFSDGPRLLAAIDAGAVGYLLKDAEPEDLVAGIRAAARGESPIDPKAARHLLTSRATGRWAEEQAAPRTVLSVREREVLDLVAAGLANKQIARRLGITERTVKGHLTSAFQRIGVADRTQAALWVERHGQR
ncbi:Transcriptional regulatory protein LiaR [Nocardioides aquaticus]|uniref:Transcriptional regulatory protein LiaR n=1 Tax=Nocardioides aquaticus TaxID=160826 RepID=A0ABX8EHH6_9ACTN|nr:response regulator transcription factor [Nocardioides aquaticus]QVT79781.1 Transcriptional regulatory protein LiaR [Nocardioides aquaticus]